jgi:hypothetical protein
MAAADVCAQSPDVPTPPSEPSAASAVPLSQSVFVDVKDLGSNVSSSTNWRSVWGSYSKDVTRARALEITLRNSAKLPGEFLVEWYFFAVPARGGKRFLFDRGSKPVTMAPGAIEKATVVSDELNSSRSHYTYDYYSYSRTHKSGTRPEGWIVAVSAGGKLLRVKTSSAQIEELYKKSDEFKALVEPKTTNEQ